jgi:macrolide transport system ATP-binding/permease protein
MEAPDGSGRGKPPTILLRGIVKDYESGGASTRILNGIDLRIEQGEFVAIVGPSGSGKTTLMNILGLMDSPTAGFFELQGRDVSSLSADQRAEARGKTFGFIFQRYNLLANETAVENVGLPGAYIGMPSAQRRERAVSLLEGLGLGHRIANRPPQLSGGEQQRVAVARALMNGGEIILADEPTGALDTARGQELIARIRELHRQGLTVILITHDPGVASQADRVIRIVDGGIISDEATERSAVPDAAPQEADSLPALPSLGERGRITLLADAAEAFRMALHALQANSFRTFLTMLGIIIGVASVVAMLAIGEGSRRDMQQWMSRMGTNVLRIEPGAKMSYSSGTLTIQDARAIADISHVQEIVPRVFSARTLRYRDRIYACNVLATTPSFIRAENRVMVRGGFFDERDEEAKAPVVVLGMKAYLELFPDRRDPVGKRILIDGAPFLVVGVITVSGGSADGRDREDDIALIPLSTGEARIFRSVRINQISVTVDDFRNVEAVQDEIRTRLNRLRQQEDFRIFNQAAMIETNRNTQRAYRFLLGAVGVVSLLVGGIGVMNIMLVNVVERTREIGVRMACGARSRDIQLQFLTEAILVCLLGGVIGVLLGMLVSGFVTIGESKAVVTLAPILLSFGAAFTTGVLFGFWPARKASRLDPVVALSSE